MRTWLFILTCLFLGVVGAILYQAFRPPPPDEKTSAEVLEPALPAQQVREGSSPLRHPVAEVPVEIDQEVSRLGLETPLPPLEESDGRIAGILARLLPEGKAGEFLVLDNFIQRFVVMVDSLPRAELPVNHLPVLRTPGDFLVRPAERGPVVDPANYRRYRPFLNLLGTVDPEVAVTVYVRFYPLFQRAYEELGYPEGYFNDRLVEVIDHLLETPEVTGPIRLIRPKVRYRYADPELESLSAGRKILIRMGPENAARLKELLQAYRGRLGGTLPKES